MFNFSFSLMAAGLIALSATQTSLASDRHPCPEDSRHPCPEQSLHRHPCPDEAGRHPCPDTDK